MTKATNRAKRPMGEIYDLFQGLSALDKDDIKLLVEIRLKIAINLNRVTPVAAAFERSITRAKADVFKANRELAEKDRRTAPELEADISDAIDKLRRSEEEIDIKTFLKAELRLDDNPKLGPRVLAQLLPIIDDAGKD